MPSDNNDPGRCYEEGTHRYIRALGSLTDVSYFWKYSIKRTGNWKLNIWVSG